MVQMKRNTGYLRLRGREDGSVKWKRGWVRLRDREDDSNKEAERIVHIKR
jgi:hypothetical protein